MLVKTYVQQGLYIEGLNVLERTQSWQLSQQETIELVLLRARILRYMGLIDRAITVLQEKGQFLPNPELRGKVVLELAACYREIRLFEEARRTLSEAFARVEPGPLAQQIGCELADACLRVDQTDQAIAVCNQLLEYTTDTAEVARIRTLLARAYRSQQDYDRAISVLVPSLNRIDTSVTSEAVEEQ
jgi:tetratricopeptide (TPR) repeat protein